MGWVVLEKKESTIKCSLRCSTCNRPLSVAPIHHNDNIGSVCGRCVQNGVIDENSDLTWTKQTIIEKIAIHFPCTYSIFGCPTTLRWDNVKNHEKHCPFVTIVCPFSHEYFTGKCLWVGYHDHLEDHIKQNHRDMLCNPPTLKVTNEIENKILLWEITGRLVIMTLIFNRDLNKYLCNVSGNFAPEVINSYQCHVSIMSDKLNSPCKIGQTRMQPIGLNHFNDSQNTLAIDVLFHLQHLAANELTLKFTVINEGFAAESDFNRQLLEELACPVCMDYMKPPILICQVGHNICEDCSKKVESCPICRAHFLGGRNYTLETLAARIKYPCVNKELGCGFLLPYEEISDHLNNCQYLGRKCFLDNCQWKGLHGDFQNHLKESHSNIMLEFDKVKVHGPHTKHYILFYDNDIFLLKFRFNADDDLEFAVFYLEKKEKNCYFYSLDLMNAPPLGMNFSMSDSCSAVPRKIDISKYDEHSVTLPSRFLKQFLVNLPYIGFKLAISKPTASGTTVPK